MKVTETTARLLTALHQLDAMDLGVLFASGVDVAVLSYTDGRPLHMDRVSVYAEDFAPVKVALQECLGKAIERRKETLKRELAQIEAL